MEASKQRVSGLTLVLSAAACCLTLQLLPLAASAVAAGQRRSAWEDQFYDYKGKEVQFGGGSGAKAWVHSGTKWCGAGNIANNFEDLGSAFETDKCCRQHDYCGIYVRPNEVKYNFKNTFLYTLSHCECDSTFLNCLKASKDAQARSVLYYFFYSLRMPCIGLQSMRTCVRQSWWDKIIGQCSEYADRETAVLMRLPQVDNERELPASLKFRANRG